MVDLTLRPKLSTLAIIMAASLTTSRPGQTGGASHEHRDADLNADAGQKTDERSARQEVGEKPQLEDASQQQETRDQKRQHADQRHVFFAGERCHARERTCEYRCGGRIRCHDVMARGAENGEADEWQED